MKIMVLGAGLVGHAIALDLAREASFEVTVVDINDRHLEKFVSTKISNTIVADLSQPQKVQKLIAKQDLVVDAVPGHLGFQTFQAVIESGKNIVDIAFFPEDPFRLDVLARKKRAIAVMDCGVAPGMSNILVADAARQLELVNSIQIYVGGLPVVREWPYEYKAVFSLIDVIEEYTRPARFMENGKLVVRPALSDPELLNFEGIGTLEAFNTDGLRTLLQTMKAPNMIEKTLRYPGHIEKMAILRESGFFDTRPVEIKGHSIRPIDFTARILFPKWELKPGEADLTVMRILVEGERNNQKLLFQYDLRDYYDPESGIHSMARTTGFTATGVVRLVAEGLYNRIGVSPPEYIGKDARSVEYILEHLKERGVIYHQKIEELE